MAREAPVSRWRSLGWSINRAALLSVSNQDHGDGRPLLEWAEDILRQHGIEDAHGEIWLQTFPKLLGYVFKPVSFWFCERQDGSCRAVITEVNNTFGGRHVYVLTPLAGPRGEICNGQTVTVDKAFYVSPFFEVKGRYQFRFFRSTLGGHELSRIAYHDDTGGLLLTSISGLSSALTQASAYRAWISAPLFSLGVIARIHLQALLLWRKGAKFVSRPKAPSASPLH